MMDDWNFISNGKFVAQETLEVSDGWVSFPESAIRVHITCPRCSTSYRINHTEYLASDSDDGCGLDVPIQDALAVGQCPYSYCGKTLPENIADCPYCGLHCREMAHIILHSNGCWSFRALRRLIKVKQR
jgi:hypothetical protein